MQELLLGLISAAMARRSILISSKRIKHANLVIQSTLNTFLGEKASIIECGKPTTWQSIENDIKHASRISKFILLSRPNNLSAPVQVCLAEMMENSPDVVLVLVGSSHGLMRILRKNIFFHLALTSIPESPSVNSSPADVIAQIPELRQRSAAVFISVEIQRYIQDIIVFVRTHRFVKKGIPPGCINDLHLLISNLCVFGGYQYATIDIAISAIKLVLPLKIDLIDPKDDISLEYGGDVDIITAWHKNWDSKLLVDTILESLSVPT